jgi:Family of unknown function (DUF5719)
MKPKEWAVLAIISLPIVSFGQSTTLSFPRVMVPGEYSSTGFALVNPDANPATVLYTLYGIDGSVQATATQTIPARGQLPKLGRELFPTAMTGGWVQATSATSGLQGFWFSGDLSTFADGAEAASPSSELVLPLIGPDSEIHLANTGTDDVTLLLSLLGTDGKDLADPFPQRIPAKGYLRGNMASLFPTLTDLSLPSHMRISCPCVNSSPVAATVIVRNLQFVTPSWSVRNGVPAASTSTTIYFPYLIEGPQANANWRSLVGLTNLSTTSSNDVVLTLFSESGAPISTSSQTLPPNGGLRFTARDLFALAGGFQSGWVNVTSTSGLPITGYIAYADLIGAGVAVVAPQQDAQNQLLFAHIADLPPWLTGIALLNPNSAPTNVTLYAINPSGTLIGSANFSLAQGANTAKLLRELVPLTQQRTSDGGFVFVQASSPIFGIELFFSRNLQILANVPAGNGSTFVPPR